MIWELVKRKIRAKSIPYCINKKKNNSFKNNLLKERNLFETELDKKNFACNLDKLNASKIELEQIGKNMKHEDTF